MTLPDYLLEAVPFVAYGPAHWVVLLVFTSVAAGLLLAARRSTTKGQRRLGAGLACVILLIMLPFQIGAMSPPFWNIQHSLPLQLCDLAWMAAVVALLTRARWASDLLYYWGLTLTVQGLITPALVYGYPHIGFFMFFALHCLVVWAAIYRSWGMGYRPNWRSYWRAVAITLGWMVSMLILNAVLGTNYGFLNAKPASASMLDALGPWPIYLFWEVAIAMLAWALLTWPWMLRRRPSVRQE